MWEFKRFKTKDSMRKWVNTNKKKYQIEEVFVNNGYAVEYRKLRKI